jgi:hypothetical protein
MLVRRTGEDCSEIKDIVYEGRYFGINLHPYDSILMKANRGTDALTLERYTE